MEQGQVKKFSPGPGRSQNFTNLNFILQAVAVQFWVGQQKLMPDILNCYFKNSLSLLKMLCTRKLSRNGDNKIVSNLFDIVGDRVRSTTFFWFTYFLCKSHYLISLLTADDSGCWLAAPESQLCGRDDRNYAADYLPGDGGWVATSETRPVEVENKLR